MGNVFWKDRWRGLVAANVEESAVDLLTDLQTSV
jgi:hypothetical protein